MRDELSGNDVDSLRENHKQFIENNKLKLKNHSKNLGNILTRPQWVLTMIKKTKHKDMEQAKT